MPRFLSFIVLMALLAGCRSAGNADAGSVDHAVFCPTCETVWVPEVSAQGTKVMTLRGREKMTCPTCDQMARSQLTGDGKAVLHDCPECKVTPKRVSRPAAPSHPRGTH